jgi:NADH-quinone oxidoreductase subunit H
MLFIFVWLRGTLPRMRYDQFMRFGWKWLIPISLVWTLMIAAVRVSGDLFANPTVRIVLVVVFLGLLALAFFGGGKDEPGGDRTDGAR